MKIRKRREPLDFSALVEGSKVEFEEVEPLDVAPDFDLSPAEPPSAADDALELAKVAPKSTMGWPSPLQKAPAAPEKTIATAPINDAKLDKSGEKSAADMKPAAAPAKVEAAITPTKADERPRAPISTPIRSQATAETPKAAKPVDVPSPRQSREPNPRPSPAPRAAAPQAPPPQATPIRTVAGRPHIAASPDIGRRGGGAGRTSTGRRRTASPAAWPLYAGAAVVTAGWTGALGALAWAASPQSLDPLALAALAGLALGPAALIWIAAFLAHQGRLLAWEASRAKTLADDMVSPAVIAAGRTGDLVQAVRDEVARAGQTAKEAREAMMALREELAAETGRLEAATSASMQAATTLAETLGRERTEMAALAQSLETQSTSAVEAIGRQTRVVAEASDLAETQLREAEASLTARAADLTAAVGSAGDAARTASEDLTRHIARLETAGGGVAEQISIVESGLVEQRAALVTASQSLRADQEVFAAEAESQTAKLSEFIGQARQSAAEMGDRAIKGADALRGLIAEAADQFREFADQATSERDAFGASTKESLEAVAAMATEQRAKLETQTRAAIEALVKASEETREAAERHAETARTQVDQLSEAAFTAGQRANQVFEARLSEARDLIERSTQMVEQAGSATAKKLDEGASVARATLQELERMLAEIETRAGQLPAAARQQAEEVRNAVMQGMDQLMAHARRTAEETEAIDLAFQERVRRNYEMLSEAVRLMGAVATTAAPPPRETRSAPTTSSRAEPPLLQEPDESAAPPKAATKAESDISLRPRLRLTPTASDEEFSSVFETAGGRAPDSPDGPDGWTWKELLSSIDEDDQAGEDIATDDAPDGRIEATLIAEIASMGIDPAALLPRARVEEIVELLQAGDADSCRTLVRRLAPAATRRLARRLFTDPTLKQQVRRYVTRHQRLIEEAGKRDKAGLELGALLASDAGRAFLMLDAAAGDGV